MRDRSLRRHALRTELEMHGRLSVAVAPRRKYHDDLRAARDPGPKSHVGRRGGREHCLFLGDENDLARARLGKGRRGEERRQNYRIFQDSHQPPLREQSAPLAGMRFPVMGSRITEMAESAKGWSAKR